MHTVAVLAIGKKSVRNSISYLHQITSLTVEMSDSRKIIHCWSGPRSLSTCSMYSFSRRPDCVVYDEPLYASFLKLNPQLFRPYRELLLKTVDTNGNSVLEGINKTDSDVVFAKHMAKHLTNDIDRNLIFTPGSVHIILIRNPLDMLNSWNNKQEVHQEGISLQSTCLPQLLSIFSEIKSLTGIPPIVLDVALLREFPEPILSETCRRIGIPFYPEQLSWPAGPKPDIDGIWASYWYEAVHKSTGFGLEFSSSSSSTSQQPSINLALSIEQIEIYRETLPFYDTLRRHAIGMQPINPGSSITTLHLPLHTATNIDGINGTVLVSSELLSDNRNVDLLAWVGDRLFPREQAKISVFDSAVQGGDAVWEGLRVYDGRIFKLEEHLDRLRDSARAMDFQNQPTREYIKRAIALTLSANGMRDGVHIRLTLTRGPKVTSSMNPVFNKFGCCLIVLPEWKPVGNAATYDNASGVSLITAANRRNSPQCVDSKIHHCNLINNILPKIQANYCGAADALMLDCEGFVSETNATNVFIVKANELITPHADYCLPGVTRETVMKLGVHLGLRVNERRVSLAECHSADEMFTTGTMGELTPVVRLDGRWIGGEGKSAGAGPVTKRIQAVYRDLTDSDDPTVATKIELL